MFTFVHEDLARLCVAEHQLVDFVEKYKEIFRFGTHSVTDMLLKCDESFLVISIYAEGGTKNIPETLGLYKSSIDYPVAHSMKYSRRLVVPRC